MIGTITPSSKSGSRGARPAPVVVDTRTSKLAASRDRSGSESIRSIFVPTRIAGATRAGEGAVGAGSMAGLASVISAMVFTSTGNAEVGILAAIGIGIVCGLINGMIIIFGRVNPVVATLAMLDPILGGIDR